MQTLTQIGFDRFIDLDWIATALRVRARESSLEDLDAQLDAAHLGREAKSKTRTKLNSLVLDPAPELVEFLDRGTKIIGAVRQDDLVPFAWGAAMVAYPYFGKVAEIVGRLTAIQGDCSVAEVHRRISELYGDREVTKRATQAVLQTQASWGVLRRFDKGKRLKRLAARPLSDQSAIAWLLEAALRYYGKAVALSALQSNAVLYPFVLGQPLAYVVSTSSSLEFRSEGASQQLVALHGLL